MQGDRRFVFNDPGFLMEDSRKLGRAPMLIAWDRHFHFEELIRYHPGKDFQGLDFALACRLQGIRQQVRLQPIAQLRAVPNRVYFLEC